jgi:osmotically-inducible protein OsmY
MQIRTDDEIKQAVLQAFQWDPRVEEAALGVVVDRGVVTLTGIVGHDVKRLVAEEVARGVEGVRGVTNVIWVVPAGD